MIPPAAVGYKRMLGCLVQPSDSKIRVLGASGQLAWRLNAQRSQDQSASIP
jgi:hypothetical protein